MRRATSLDHRRSIAGQARRLEKRSAAAETIVQRAAPAPLAWLHDDERRVLQTAANRTLEFHRHNRSEGDSQSVRLIARGVHPVVGAARGLVSSPAESQRRLAYAVGV